MVGCRLYCIVDCIVDHTFTESGVHAYTNETPSEQRASKVLVSGILRTAGPAAAGGRSSFLQTAVVGLEGGMGALPRQDGAVCGENSPALVTS